jgi:serine/threonine-protein kinase HipA
MSQCTLFGLAPSAAKAQVLQVIAVVDQWQAHFKACGVTDADIVSLAERIDGSELLEQRRGFGSV